MLNNSLTQETINKKKKYNKRKEDENRKKDIPSTNKREKKIKQEEYLKFGGGVVYLEREGERWRRRSQMSMFSTCGLLYMFIDEITKK